MAGELAFYLLLVGLVAVPLLILLGSERRTAARTRLPPGPWALPVVGHLHHLAGGLPPHRAMRDLARRHGPLMLLRLGEVEAVVASSPDAAREIMRTHDVAFASRPVGPMSRLWFQGADGLVFAPYGEAWRRLRRVCTQELLSHRRVQSFRPVREDELGRLLRAVDAAAAAGTAVNLTAMMSTYVADSTVRAIIGSRRLKDRDAFLRMLDELFTIMPGMSLPDLFPSSRLAMLVSRAPGRIMRYRRRMRRIMDSIIHEHQERRAAADAAGDDDDDDDEDLVDVLLRLQKEVGAQYPLTTENIKTVMMDIFGAASETSSTTLEWVMAELMRSPSAMRKAQDEVRRALAAGAAGHDTVTEDILPNLNYLKLVVKETLRLHPPAPLLAPRRCDSPREVLVLGHDVPAGATVLVNAWAIGRDTAAWGGAAEEFSPERFERCERDFRGADFELIPFGAGRRMCPGMAFGLVHVELALAALLFHFDWSLPGGMAADELDMAESSGLTTRRRLPLLVVARPHAALPTKYCN
ncbi:hypothetical protein OsI_06151 [Oryza sativa Indica Group]|uniref:Cytochrome P450 n=2 Tax=Oryza TaxID=4527 RepID=A0A0E0G2Y7_ORYNI|nr:hypothetical protein OsI_06151 [Oryza sativa Indica Group]